MQDQNYANHAHRPTAWMITWVVSFVVVVLSMWAAFRAPSLERFALVVLALVVCESVLLMRRFALRLQDRIIRLEVQARLEKLGRAHDIARVTMAQLVALRFASDAELPALLDRAVGERLSADQIKRAVTSWQGDYLRT